MAGYIGSKASVVSSGAERKKTFAITTLTTSLTGLVYTPTKAHVFHNGVRLVDGTDYTATDGTSITLNSAAESGDEVVVISYAGFQVADAYTQAEADAEFVQDPNGAITVSGSNVGIGTINPSEALHVYDASAATDSQGIRNSTFRPHLTLEDLSTNAGDWQVWADSGDLSFLYGDVSPSGTDGAKLTSEAMRIDSSGNVGIGTASLSDATLNVRRSSNSGYGIQAEQSGTLNVPYSAYLRNAGTKAFDFRWYGATIGSITNSGGTSIAYNTSSDYRLKEDWQPMTGASDRVLALNPVNFAWKANGSRVDGFLAHEVQAVVPECATGTKDAMMDEDYEVTPAVLDDDGSETTAAVMGTRSVPDYQGIDQSKLVPLLTAALQEALAKIDDMETRLAALEGN